MLIPLVLSFFLALFSLVNLFGVKPNLFTNQLVYFVLAAGLYFVFKKIGWRFFRDNANFFYWIFVFLLAITLILGVKVNGSRRWIDLYFFNFQASEIFKVFFIAFFADFFTRNKKNIDEPEIFFKSLGYFIIPALLIFRQPDLGNTLVYCFIFLIMLLFSGVSRKKLLYSIIIILIMTPLFWLTLKGYQKLRLINFLNPTYDVSGAGYNIIQATIAIGSGKFLGRGLGYGTQSKLLFLPENHTDFAFSSLVEQFGFFGGICVLFFYFLLSFLVIKKIIKFQKNSDSDSHYKFLFTLGFLAYLIFHVFVNIGMNLGLLPVTGIVLPLISYGGSAVVAFILGIALLP